MRSQVRILPGAPSSFHDLTSRYVFYLIGPPRRSGHKLRFEQSSEAEMHLDSNSAAYYRQREAQEREMAAKAQSQEIFSIHLSMANRYRILAEEAACLENDGKS